MRTVLVVLAAEQGGRLVEPGRLQRAHLPAIVQCRQIRRPGGRRTNHRGISGKVTQQTKKAPQGQHVQRLSQDRRWPVDPLVRHHHAVGAAQEGRAGEAGAHECDQQDYGKHPKRSTQGVGRRH